MEFQTVEPYELTDNQLSYIEEIANDTLPGGQSFFLEDNGEIHAIENNLMSLFVAQNQKEIESGELRKIAF
jgi:hypothetical protein